MKPLFGLLGSRPPPKAESKKAVGKSLFSFEGVASMRAAVDAAAAGGDGASFVARSTGRSPDGTVVAEFDITWSFKRRS